MFSAIILITMGLCLSALLCLAKTEEEVLQNVLQKAKNGDIKAMIMLAEAFEHRYYDRFSDCLTYKYTNDSKILPGIGGMLHKGNEIPHCDEWYKKADKKGHKDALFCLARFYSRIEKQELPFLYTKRRQKRGIPVLSMNLPYTVLPTLQILETMISMSL